MMLSIGYSERLSLCARVRAKAEEEAMNTEYIVTAIIALLLLGYLGFALLKPEKF